MTKAALFITGWALWTISEYVLHRWLMHAPRGSGPLASGHFNHHAHPDDASWTVVTAALVRILTIPVAAGVSGWRLASGSGLAVSAGWSLGYIAYEILHWRLHGNEPLPALGRYDLWLRRRHLHHHFENPDVNFGVTVDSWDRILGTRQLPGRVRVPPQLAPPWMLDSNGKVRTVYRDDYELRGVPFEKRPAAHQEA